MTDRPPREPVPPDPDRDREGDEPEEAPTLRPSAPEGDEADAGSRPPRPSQAEGEREPDGA